MTDPKSEIIPPETPAPSLLQRRPAHAVMTHLLGLVREHRARGFEDLPEDGRSWHDGAWGEIIVGQELAFLPPGWHVLHAVPAGSAGADIDHLAIGPAGVFVINTKRHPNASIRVGSHVVWINGFQQDHYQGSLRKRCDQVEQVLLRTTGERPTVHPVLVFVQARRVTCTGTQTVLSATASGLVGLLQSMPPALAPDQVQAVVSAAGRPSTWGAPDRVLLEPDPTSEFLALSAPGTDHPVAAPHRMHRPGSITRQYGRQYGRRPSPPPSVSRLLRLLVALMAVAVGLPIASLILSVVLSAWTGLLMSH